jgi:hypothetical protein
MMIGFACTECEKTGKVQSAKWRVWFAVSSLYGFEPYVYLCDEHLITLREAWKATKYPLTCAKPIPEQL